MTQSLFLLGAGFNVDAKAEVGPVYNPSLGQHEIECGYPLVGDLWRLCFGIEPPPEGISIESRFYEEQTMRNFDPIAKLAKALMKADYFLVPLLLSNAANQGNSYATFFHRFASSSFLTFNYDSLVELFLLDLGKWYPQDGFGVPVGVELQPGAPAHLIAGKSASLVLHLHGSLCVETSDVEYRTVDAGPGTHLQEIVTRPRPLFEFEPHSIGSRFGNYKRPQRLDRKSIERRVIAPILNKGSELKQAFVREAYQRARELLAGTDELVVIGYSFNVHDRASYDPILSSLSARPNPSALVVTRDAINLTRRLTQEYPRIRWQAEQSTFRSWAARGFPGLL